MGLLFTYKLYGIFRVLLCVCESARISSKPIFTYVGTVLSVRNRAIGLGAMCFVCVRLIPHPHYHFLSRNRCHPAIESWSFVMRECRGFYRSITSIHTHSSNQPTNLHLTLTHFIPIWVVLSVSLHFSPNTEMRRKTKSKHSAMHSDSSKCSKVNIDRIKF